MTKKIRIGKYTIKIWQIILFVVLAAFAFVMIAPFLWVLSASVRNYSDATSLPPKWLMPKISDWDLTYIKKLFSDKIPFFTWMLNSLKISTAITIGMVFNGAIAGYAYARFCFRGKKLMFSLMLVAMMIPVQVTIVPLYKVMSSFHLINTMWAVALPGILGAVCPGLAGGFGIFMMRQFFMTIPKEMEEAAWIDGAGPIRTFFSIMLPLSKASLASLAIIVFTFSWNDYFTSFIMINSTSKLTLPVGILQVKQPFSTGDNVVFAAICLSILPVLILFVFFQKWIVQSMVNIGVKG